MLASLSAQPSWCSVKATIGNNFLVLFYSNAKSPCALLWSRLLPIGPFKAGVCPERFIQLRSVQLSVHTIFLIILSCYIAMPFNLFISMSVGLPFTQHPLGWVWRGHLVPEQRHGGGLLHPQHGEVLVRLRAGPVLRLHRLLWMLICVKVWYFQ